MSPQQEMSINIKERENFSSPSVSSITAEIKELFQVSNITYLAGPQNFPQWRRHLNTYLKIHNLRDYIVAPKMSEYKNDIVISVLMRTTAKKYHKLLAHCTSAYQAFKKLTTHITGNIDAQSWLTFIKLHI